MDRSTVGLYVAVYTGTVYKHWSIYMDGALEEDKTILHIMGSSGNYRFETRNHDPRRSARLIELLHLSDVAVSKVGAIKEIAQNMTIHNNAPGYNCQDYVLDVLDELESESIIDDKDAGYKTKKKNLKAKQEGFD